MKIRVKEEKGGKIGEKLIEVDLSMTGGIINLSVVLAVEKVI